MATAQHPKASAFVQQRLFAGLSTFAELEQRIAALPDEQSRGAAFEVFAEAYLATQRKHDAAQVWPHGSVPLDLLKNLGLTQQDQGVDGVLQTLLGQFNAYQIKFRTGRPSLTWRELSTFIGLADSPHIHSRVLLTNCDELPAVLNDRQGFFCIRGSDLDRLEAGDFRAMEAWLADAAFIAPKKSPQPHQTEALDALLPALQTHDRVSAIMACGTGKTLVALWVAEKIVGTFGSRGATDDNSPAFQRRVKSTNDLSPAGTTEVSATKPSPDEIAPSVQPSRWDSLPMQPQPGVETPGYVSGCPVGTNDGGIPAAKILVLLPSLALLRQTLHEWLRETHLPSLAYLCVCSDPTVKEGIDALTTQQSDLDFQVSTDAASVRRFLDAPFAGVKMIFSTYQSASVVGAAMPPGEAFDLAVFDEAHKTAGREGRNFAFALDDKNLPIRKRLFLTATPRHYNPHDRDREGEARLLFSMDNPAVYGPQAYRLTFAEAARRGIICGYKVIISVITSEMVTNDLLSHGEVLVNGDPVRARQVANQIALRDAIEKYGVSKVFTFHKTVASAASFVSDGSEGIRTHLPDFKTFHVNGTMPTARRERELRDFRAAARAVVSNARCLTEGVDVPAVDMVAFLSPRRSRVDIVQATGRAMRKPKDSDKTIGYVLVPLYLEQATNESIGQAVLRSNFSEVWDVLQSLQEQDDVLAEIIREMSEQKGRGKGYDDNRFAERIEFTGPSLTLESLKTYVTTRCLENLYVSWNEWLGKLQAFKEGFGHCNVGIGMEDYQSLGAWVTAQRIRRKKGVLGDDQISRLNDLAFDWDAQASSWNSFFEKLKSFKERFGHCNVETGWDEDPVLAGWISAQRTRRNKDLLSPERIRLLDELGFVWDFQSQKGQETWMKWYRELETYVREHGNPHVTRSYANTKLASWVWIQRQRRKGTIKSKGKVRDLMTVEQISLLDKLGFRWDAREDKWTEQFEQLKQFKEQHGHFDVEQVEGEESELSGWVSTQRNKNSSGEIQAERKNQLDSIGFKWTIESIIDLQWQEMYEQLKTYHAEHGTADVPAKWKENRKLANWVSAQRQSYQNGLMPADRKTLLDELSFSWKQRERVSWDDRLAEVAAFKAKNGHCEIPVDKTRLGRFINTTRSKRNRGELSADRIAKLDAIGFVWKSTGRRKSGEVGISATWQAHFDELVRFKQKRGDCKVPTKWVENCGLGIWVSNQRQLKKLGKLSPEKEQMLNELRFIWNSRSFEESR
jgi:superfamily II DNA or RNA helicase